MMSSYLYICASQVLAQLSRLRDPNVAVPVVATTILGSVALYNYHLTLEYIGLAGLAWSLYTGSASEVVANLFDSASRQVAQASADRAQKVEASRRVAAAVAARPPSARNSAPARNAASEIMAMTTSKQGMPPAAPPAYGAEKGADQEVKKEAGQAADTLQISN